MSSLDATSIPKLLELLETGTPIEKESAALAFCNLAVDPANQSLIGATPKAISYLVDLLSTGTDLVKERAAGALQILGINPEKEGPIDSTYIRKIDDLFREFYREGGIPRAQLILKMVNFFSPLIGQWVLNTTGERLRLTWNAVISHLTEVMGEADLKDRLIKHQAIFATRIFPVSIERRDEWYFYHYALGDPKAQEDCNRIKFLLRDYFPEISSLQVSSGAGSSFQLTAAQHEKFESIRHQARLNKTLRWDARSFYPPFLESITHRDSKVTEPRRELRSGPPKKFRTFGSKVYKAKDKPPRAIALSHQKLLSRPQSVTLITKHNQVPLFQSQKDSVVQVGFAFRPKSSDMRRFIKIDTGTVCRPYDHDTQRAAEDFIAQHRGDYFDDYDSFKTALRGTTRYNEIMAGLYYELDSTDIRINKNNLSSGQSH
jgi:hypothetical protein